MKVAHEVVFKEADEQDVQAVIAFLNQVAQESDYLIAEHLDLVTNVEQMAAALQEICLSLDRFCLLAQVADQVIGLVSVMTDRHPQINHVGDIFIAVLKDYWGQGLGGILLEETIAWSEVSGIIRRLELTVQKRNHRAVSLYQKCGFEIEGTKKRGAKTSKGEWLDLYYMGRLIENR